MYPSIHTIVIGMGIFFNLIFARNTEEKQHRNFTAQTLDTKKPCLKVTLVQVACFDQVHVVIRNKTFIHNTLARFVFFF